MAWLPEQLTELIDARIAYLVRNRYSSERVTHQDVFPPDVDGMPVMDWILERTLMRPRDCIAFVNEAISQAVGRSRITVKMMREAEGHYSRGRLRSLADEWVGDFANLIRFTDLIKSRPSQFKMADLTDDDVETLCLNIAVEKLSDCPLRTIAIAVGEGNLSPRIARNAIVEILFKVGLVGLKSNGTKRSCGRPEDDGAFHLRRSTTTRA